jgi:hypothetical protein
MSENAEVERLSRLLTEARDERDNALSRCRKVGDAVGDLLAVILGDGGHRQAEVGTERAAREALKVVQGLRQRLAERPADDIARALASCRVDATTWMAPPPDPDRSEEVP